jgi:hypothetical protein
MTRIIFQPQTSVKPWGEETWLHRHREGRRAYKGGADALNDLLAGQVRRYVSPTLAILPPWNAGRVRLLASRAAIGSSNK